LDKKTNQLIKRISNYRDPYFWLACALIFSIIVRISYFLCYGSSFIFFLSPTGEGRSYLDLSRSIVQFDIFDKEFLFHSPLYSLFVAWSRFFLGRFTSTYLLQGILGLTNVWLLFIVTKELFNPKAAAISSWLYALTPAFLFYETKLTPFTLSATFLLLTLWAFTKNIRGKNILGYALIGFFIASLCYLYTQYFLLMPLMLFPIVGITRKTAKLKVSALAASAVGFLVLAFPFVLWNQMTADKFTPAPYTSSYLFYANNESPLKNSVEGANFKNPYTNVYRKSLELSEFQNAKLMEPDEISSFLISKRLKAIGKEPLSFLQLISSRGMNLFSLVPNTYEKSFGMESVKCFTFNMTFLPELLSLVLGLIFFFKYPLRLKEYSAILSLVLTALFAYFLLDPSSAYKNFIILPLLPLASQALLAIYSPSLRRPLIRILRICLLLSAATLVIAFQVERQNDDDEIHYLFNVALANDYLNRHAEAVRYYYEIIKRQPVADIHLLRTASLSALKGQFYIEAEKFLNKGLTIKPDSPDFRNNLGLVYMKQGKLREAREEFLMTLEKHPYSEEALFNMGLVLRALGQHKDAIKYLEVIPDWARNYYSAGNLMGEIQISLKNWPEATRHFLKLSQKFRDDPYFKFKLKLVQDAMRDRNGS
jgi:tetratricopeptide (TPR) repeat protein